jgi:hypothetical protein
MKYHAKYTPMMMILPLLAACSGGDGSGSAQAPQLETAVATQSIAQPAVAVQPLTDFGIWSKRMMVDAISPVVAGPGDLSQVWTGADGHPANVVVQAPRTAGKPTVSISPPAADANATPIFQAAIAQLRKAGGGILKVAPGEYHFKTSNTEQPGLGHMLLSKLTDVDIQAGGANLIFEGALDAIIVQDSQRVRIEGAEIHDARVLSGTGRMRTVDGVLRLELDKALPVGMTINWVQPMNEGTTRSWPQIQSRAIIDPSAAQPTRIDDRTFVSPLFKTLKNGQYVAVKFSYYGNRAIYIRDSFSGVNGDIIIDGVHIGSIGGMGIGIRTRGRGFAIQNSTIAADDGKPYSTNYDGIHVAAAAGDILIRQNSFSHAGDDDLNLRSVIHKATNVSNEAVTLSNEARLIRVGDEIAFFTSTGEYIGRRKIKSAPPIGTSDTVTFGLEAGEPINEAVYARDINITPRRFAVVNNTLADNAGRGMLIQVPNGLIQGNVIRDQPRTAIRLLTSFDPWLEGAGAINVRVTGNTIDSGGAELGFSYTTGIIMAMGEVLSGKVAPNVHNGPIMIDNNKFTAPRAACVAIYSTQGLVQQNNVCGGT